MLITCNQPFKDWDRIFLDKQMAVAAIDRLVHNASILEIEAECNGPHFLDHQLS
jgi:DNA replication protein DnaC